MCKCCQLCLEDLYWQCFEEKYCYDESIANYDPAEDEYFRSNGHVENKDNNNQPITVQPSSRIHRNISTNSTKIHEDDIRREIQTANVNLPPEILQVFAGSQIFHDHKPLKSKSQQPAAATFSIGAVKIENKLEQINEERSDKLLQRLEQDEKLTKHVRGKRVLMGTPPPPKIIETPDEERDDADDIDAEVVLRPKHLNTMNTAVNDEVWTTKPVNKRLQLNSPYFIQRPASENDIFTISSKDDQQVRPTLPTVSSTTDVNFRFSMTPEVPSISFANLPKNYLETPSIDKFKKQEPTLQEIQTAEIQKTLIDFSMPRYYGKSDLILNRNAVSFEAIGGGSNSSIASMSSASSNTKKQIDKNKRLKQFRAHLPPLMIHKDKTEKEK